MSDDYHSDISRIGKSGLDLVHQSPRHYWNRYLNPERQMEKETPALIFGRLLHSFAFEPETVPKNYVIKPYFDLRSKQAKADYQEFLMLNKGKTIVTDEQFDLAQVLIRSVKQHPAANLLLNDPDGMKEYRIDFIHPETGTPAKAKMDFYSEKTGFIIDLKSTDDASPAEFGKSVWNYRYDVQAAWYLDAFESYFGEPARGFIFVAVEKTEPFEVAVYVATQEIIEVGRNRYMPDLITYEECRQSGEWPGYGDTIMPLTLPAWAVKTKR